MKLTGFATLSVALLFGIVFSGCSKEQPQTTTVVSDETTAVAAPVEEEEEVIDLDEIMLSAPATDTAASLGAFTTGDAVLSIPATTGDASGFNVDMTTGDAPIEPVKISIIEDDAEANPATSTFFFQSEPNA